MRSLSLITCKTTKQCSNWGEPEQVLCALLLSYCPLVHINWLSMHNEGTQTPLSIQLGKGKVFRDWILSARICTGQAEVGVSVEATATS